MHIAALQVGLAVDDIKQVQEDAELKRLALQVTVVIFDHMIVVVLADNWPIST